MVWTDKGIVPAPSVAETMWERFVAKLNATQPLRNGEHVAMLGSLESYKRIFLEANNVAL